MSETTLQDGQGALGPEAQAIALYNTYPRHVGRGAALAAIRKALTKEKFDVLRTKVCIFAGAVAGWPQSERRFVPHPATWFNQERWADDESEWYRGGARQLPADSALGASSRPKVL